MNFPRIPMLNHTRAYLLQACGKLFGALPSEVDSARKGWTVEITLS